MRRRAIAFALVAFVSGCLLFPAVDDLGGAADAQGLDATSGDAPEDRAETGGDAGADATANGNDASDATALDAPQDAPTPFCAQHASAVFCADFDESTDPAAGFTNNYLTDGGVLARDTTAFVSSPASLLAGNTTLASSASAHGAEVRYTSFKPTQSATVDFDLRIDALATQGSYVEAFAMVFEGAPKSSIQLNVKSASSEVGEELDPSDGGAKTYVGHTFPSPITVGQWVHVTIALSLAARTLTVTVDANVVVDHVTISPSFTTGNVDLYVGNAYSPGPSSGASIHYDDVLLVAN